ncbi:hypothetical protein C2G38_2194993 [Gigaspora rosea]|uniref:Uncharacterized protein n=1 Tax=Gigaspora rosea TaxID=44941 RepID=A0A397UYQ6_9GLOM|nr:hypothetical protein C2G38_2194993 [Gigaspora rosea]
MPTQEYREKKTLIKIRRGTEERIIVDINKEIRGDLNDIIERVQTKKKEQRKEEDPRKTETRTERQYRQIKEILPNGQLAEKIIKIAQIIKNKKEQVIRSK